MNTHYTFTKDGKTYAAHGMNRFDAQEKAELQHGIDLTGAEWHEVYKTRIVRAGRC